MTDGLATTRSPPGKAARRFVGTSLAATFAGSPLGLRWLVHVERTGSTPAHAAHTDKARHSENFVRTRPTDAADASSSCAAPVGAKADHRTMIDDWSMVG